jgi:hypothetical protein
MTKHELLKSVGFSEEYMEHLRKVEASETRVFESLVGEYQPQSYDVTNLIVDESVNSFSTRLVTR